MSSEGEGHRVDQEGEGHDQDMSDSTIKDAIPEKLAAQPKVRIVLQQNVCTLNCLLGNFLEEIEWRRWNWASVSGIQN